MFDWDEANIRHIARHHVSPDEAEQVILNDPLELQRQERSGEQRILHLGTTDSGRLLIVAVTMRNAKSRVVTAYSANRRLRNFYSAQKAISDEEHPQDA